MFRFKALTFFAAPLLALSLLATGCGKVKPGSRNAPAGVKANPNSNSSGNPSSGGGGSSTNGSTGNQYNYWTCGIVEAEGAYSSQQYWIDVEENGMTIRVNLIPIDSLAQDQLFSAYGRPACAYGDEAVDYGPQTSYLLVKRVWSN